MPWYLGNSEYAADVLRGAGIGFIAVWSMVWTGLALWHAAQRKEKGWFIVFLFVHTAGIGEILYLLFIAHAFNTSHSTRKRKH